MRRSERSWFIRQPSVSPWITPNTPHTPPVRGLGLNKKPSLSAKLIVRMSNRNQSEQGRSRRLCCLSPKRAGAPPPHPYPPPPCCFLQIQSLNSLWIYQTNILEVGLLPYQSTQLVPRASDIDCVARRNCWNSWRVCCDGLKEDSSQERARFLLSNVASCWDGTYRAKSIDPEKTHCAKWIG